MLWDKQQHFWMPRDEGYLVFIIQQYSIAVEKPLNVSFINIQLYHSTDYYILYYRSLLCLERNFKLRMVLTIKPHSQRLHRKKHSSLDSNIPVYYPSKELNYFNSTEVERKRSTMACVSLCSSFYITAHELKQKFLPHL